MEMKQRDEKKRSILWRIVTIGSTLIIILVLGFFITDSVFGNPLEGEWIAEEKGYYLEIDDENELTVEGTFNGKFQEIDLFYTMDKAAKTITIHGDAEITALWTTEETSEYGDAGSVTFEYNLERKTLVLIDPEYGNQFTFTRK
ncbi:MAG: hypothetical protein IJZ53_00140 [Tyzzerella sp.]|nr:hypothetical protein [Tyzzerella sp.]